MDRYFFIVHDTAIVIDDENGTMLADDQAARERAIQIIKELKADSGFADGKCLMIVTRGGLEVCRIPFSSVAA